MLADGLAGFERARDALSRKVADELDAARQETQRLAQTSAARVLEEAERAAGAESVLAEAREAEELRSREVVPGQRARVRGLGAEADVVSFHGHGTGRLRDGLRDHLRKHGAVESLKAGDRNEGGNGATILELR